VVGDDVTVSLGRDEHLPVRVRWRDEAGDRIVKVTDQPGCPRQPVTWFEQAELVWPRHGAGDEAQHLPAMLINAQRAGRALKADRVQIRQQRVHRGRVRPSGAADGVTHSHHAGACVPSGKRLLWAAALIHATQCLRPPEACPRSSGAVIFGKMRRPTGRPSSPGTPLA
jgi:hypothetical protein